MHAIVLQAPGDLRIEKILPVTPRPNEVRIEIKAGGICGSDLHYYNHGGTAAIRLREPMTLGHEVSGVVVERGGEVTGIAVGTRVAVNPSMACGQCRSCVAGLRNHCLDMHFMGSAMRFPHDQGAFRQSLTVPVSQAVPIAEHVSFRNAAMAEPLAVCLHAANIAGSLLSKRVLITGAGPIGALMSLVARAGGASEIVVTDLCDYPLEIVRKGTGATTHNVGTDPDAIMHYNSGKGHFDLCFEASGNAIALRGALPALRPCGKVVQLGMGGEFDLPIMG
jgi:L-idonate 5-dehydrogenase